MHQESAHRAIAEFSPHRPQHPTVKHGTDSTTIGAPRRWCQKRLQPLCPTKPRYAPASDWCRSGERRSRSLSTTAPTRLAWSARSLDASTGVGFRRQGGPAPLQRSLPCASVGRNTSGFGPESAVDWWPAMPAAQSVLQDRESRPIDWARRVYPSATRRPRWKCSGHAVCLRHTSLSRSR